MIEEDPDLAKPKFMPLQNVPKSYGKKIMLKHTGLAQIKEEEIEAFEDSLNQEIFRDLGNFGDIVEKSRRQIVGDYVCPDDKEPVVFEYYRKPEMPDLPEPMEPFETTFA